jgi:hypothetical protein
MQDLKRRVLSLAVSFSAIIAMISAFGCEMLHNAGVPGLKSYVKINPAEVKKEQICRDNFQLHRDHKSLYWLLANRIQTGMQLHEVEQVLGEPGERETDMSRLKSDGMYQTTDLVYKWGPDETGHSVVLFFRDGHLVNFDRNSFKTD